MGSSKKKQIKNREARSHLCNIPKIEAYIAKRIATYIGKISRSDDNFYPKLSSSLDNEKKEERNPPIYFQ